MARRKVTDKQIADALRESQGIITEAAGILGMHRNSISSRIKGSEELQAIVDEERDALLDKAEAQLANMALSAHPDQFKALRFLLRTIGRTRGYGDRQEIEHSGDLKTRFVVTIPGVDDDEDA